MLLPRGVDPLSALSASWPHSMIQRSTNIFATKQMARRSPSLMRRGAKIQGSGAELNQPGDEYDPPRRADHRRTRHEKNAGAIEKRGQTIGGHVGQALKFDCDGLQPSNQPVGRHDERVERAQQCASPWRTLAPARSSESPAARYALATPGHQPARRNACFDHRARRRAGR